MVREYPICYNNITKIFGINSRGNIIMEIQLAGTLKSLRQKNNKTQDDLALFLGISSQAVSKWERSEGFPDITLLPRIAGYFTFPLMNCLEWTKFPDKTGLKKLQLNTTVSVIMYRWIRITGSMKGSS